MTPKWLPKYTKTALKAKRMTPRAPKSAQERPRRALEAKMTPKALQNDPQSSPKLSKINTEWFQNQPRITFWGSPGGLNFLPAISGRGRLSPQAP